MIGRRTDPCTLTPRELEVLGRLCEGRTARAIAAELHVSYNTARMHVQNVLVKLGVGTREQAAAHAFRTGLAGHLHDPVACPACGAAR